MSKQKNKDIVPIWVTSSLKALPLPPPPTSLSLSQPILMPLGNSDLE